MIIITKDSQGRQREVGFSGFDPSDIQTGIVTYNFLSQVQTTPDRNQPFHNLPDKKVISLPFHSANYRIYTLIYNYIYVVDRMIPPLSRLCDG